MTGPPAPLQRHVRSEDQPGAEERDNLQDDPQTHPSVRRRGWARLALALTVRALTHPRLAVDLVSLMWALRARGWYRRPPFLPLPPSEYIRWRMQTAYGDEWAVPPIDDVVRFARWRRRLFKL